VLQQYLDIRYRKSPETSADNASASPKSEVCPHKLKRIHLIRRHHLNCMSLKALACLNAFLRCVNELRHTTKPLELGLPDVPTEIRTENLMKTVMIDVVQLNSILSLFYMSIIACHIILSARWW
jgi:hypothetical protein